MNMNSDHHEENITAASRRAAGISALRKIRQLVDEERALDRLKAHWASNIIAICALVFLFTLAYFLVTKVW